MPVIINPVHNPWEWERDPGREQGWEHIEVSVFNWRSRTGPPWNVESIDALSLSLPCHLSQSEWKRNERMIRIPRVLSLLNQIIYYPNQLSTGTTKIVDRLISFSASSLAVSSLFLGSLGRTWRGLCQPYESDRPNGSGHGLMKGISLARSPNEVAQLVPFAMWQCRWSKGRNSTSSTYLWMKSPRSGTKTKTFHARFRLWRMRNNSYSQLLTYVHISREKWVTKSRVRRGQRSQKSDLVLARSSLGSGIWWKNVEQLLEVLTKLCQE